MKAPTRLELLLSYWRRIRYGVFEWLLGRLFGQRSMFENRWWSLFGDVLERLAGHTCYEKGCKAIGDPCYITNMSDDGIDAYEPFAYYCVGHKFKNGFCVGCGQFNSGIENFDFGNGFCDNCAPEFEDHGTDEYEDDPYGYQEEWDD